jgi:hypothetical protein
MFSRRAKNVLVYEVLEPMPCGRIPCCSGRNSRGSPEQGIHPQPLDIAARSTAPAAQKVRIRPNFANSLLNSLLAGNCARRKHERRPQCDQRAPCLSDRRQEDFLPLPFKQGLGWRDGVAFPARRKTPCLQTPLANTFGLSLNPSHPTTAAAPSAAVPLPSPSPDCAARMLAHARRSIRATRPRRSRRPCPLPSRRGVAPSRPRPVPPPPCPHALMIGRGSNSPRSTPAASS